VNLVLVTFSPAIHNAHVCWECVFVLTLFKATATEARALRLEGPRAYLLANAVATGEPAQFV
jgi:hypothetical protein